MMKDVKNEIMDEIEAKLLYWRNIKSKRNKTLLIVFLLSLVGLKVFTTVLTFEWLAGLFNWV
ncbi:hypothetical protein [Colwellia sp. MB02u-6]|jgi:hypothetical protein|uniref:hypothetical protein n=1 Tax=Colwellia sp. MB02u-6 TaxID=2759824 RepID=UPI0021755BD3|nr:hypothetical protein [Colwellia sp. MB02u-6]